MFEVLNLCNDAPGGGLIVSVFFLTAKEEAN